MVSVSLKDLIEIGKIGAVCLGASKQEVESILGTPDDVSRNSRSHRKSSLWKYGDIEFHFGPYDENLWLIHLDDFDVPSGGKSLHLDPWIVRRTLTLVEAEGHLSRNNINYTVVSVGHGDNSKYLVSGVGAKLLFVDEATLSALSYSSHD
jgi:hypothetical protein